MRGVLGWPKPVSRRQEEIGDGNTGEKLRWKCVGFALTASATGSRFCEQMSGKTVSHSPRWYGNVFKGKNSITPGPHGPRPHQRYAW
jgi:hypothetical protein